MYIARETDHETDSYVNDGIALKISDTIIDNTVIVGTSATISTSSDYASTDYIGVSEGDTLIISAVCGGSVPSNNFTGLFGYDDNKEFVSVLINPGIAYGWNANMGVISSKYATYDNYVLVVPNGISFVRLSSRKTGKFAHTPDVYKLSTSESVKSLTAAVGTNNSMPGFRQGSLNQSGVTIAADNRIRSLFIDMTNKRITVKTNGQKVAYCLFDSSESFLYNSGWKYSDFDLIPVKTATKVRFVVAEMNDADLTVADLDAEITIHDGLMKTAEESNNPINGFINTPFTGNVEMIMHRGYNSIAPENTIPAFKLARKMGFSAIETDVQLTVDSVPVILHDGTISRTSNGTGNVYDKSLEELKALDFGSWMSSIWTGTTIPTFEEMLACCKKIGLKVYIEVKQESPWTQELITECVNLVRKHGMKEHVAWISFSKTILGYVKTADETATLGYLMTTYTTGAVDSCISLRTEKNKVYAATRYDLLSSGVLNYMIEKDVPLIAYLFDKNTDADAMQPYVVGALTNEFNAMKYIYEQNISLT